MARRLVLGSLAFAAAASVVLVVVPSYRQETLTTFADDDPSTATTVATSSRTVVDVHGPRALVVLAVPVFLAALPLAAPRAWLRSTTTVAAILLVAFVLVTGFSVGLAYIPAAALMSLAAARARGRRVIRP
jgi:hypothetical protein